MLNSFNSGPNNERRKKKRSYLQRQKRNAKRGNFGRGTPLSQDMYDYFINIIKAMNSNKEDEEEMSTLASNVLAEISGKESEYCCNQIVSRLIEDILPYASDVDFLNFITKFSENLRPIFSDTFGSHVLQQTVVVAFVKYKKHVLENSDADYKKKFFDYIVKISNFLFNNLEDFIWDMYSNAVGRTVFNVLSGNPVKGEVKDMEVTIKSEDFKLPEEFISLLKKFAKKILSWPHLNNLFNQNVNSNFLQSFLIATKNYKESSQMIDKIIDFYMKSPLDLTCEDNVSFLRLLEVGLIVSDEKIFNKMYESIFKDKLIEMAKSKTGNFAIQKLILNCADKEQFRELFNELENVMEEILQREHTGILLALVKNCQKLGVCQGECMTMLTKTFHITDSKDIVPALIALKPMETSNYESDAITLHGCLVVQELLNFKKPINLVNSILNFEEIKLVKVLCDVKGCHITDAFVRSPYIGEKSRDRIFKKLKGHFVELATSKHGSRSLDAIWSVLNLQQKIVLLDELKLRQSDLNVNMYGKGFAWKIRLDNYRRNKDEWVKCQQMSNTAAKYFSDIIPAKKRKFK